MEQLDALQAGGEVDPAEVQQRIDAVLDNAPAFAGLDYRGIPVLADTKLSGREAFDGIVLSNINPAQVDLRAAQLAERFSVPILRLWEPRMMESPKVPASKESTWTAPPPPDVERAA